MNLFIPVLIALSILLHPGIASATSEQATETELQAVKQDISDLKKRLSQLNKKKSSEEVQISKTEKQVASLKAEISAIEKKITTAQKEIKQLQSRQRTLESKIEREKQRIAISLRSLYLSGGEDRIKLLLNQEDPEALSRQLVYLDYFQRAQLKSINNFKNDIAELETNQQQQHGLAQDLRSKSQALKQKNRTLEQQNKKRQQLVSKLNQQYLKNDKQLDALEKQRSELESILATLKSRAVNNSTPFNTMKGKLPWPVDGKLLFHFNERRPDTKMRWQGVFIAAPDQQQARAVHDGRIIFADWLRGYGLLIIVDHGNDYLTLYAHNQSLLKGEGDVVLAGEPLAYIGKTGGQSRPGLYFEIRHKGTPLDPSQWLRK